MSIFVFLPSCTPDQPPRRHLSGSTMGTSYTVTYYGGPSAEQLRPKLRTLFTEIDQQLSNWNPDSWIRRFNEHNENTAIDLPEHARTLLRSTLRLSKKTDGALDPTLGQLINMWGFGPFDPERPIDQHRLQKVLRSTGIEKLTLHNHPPALSKSHPALRLNLSATAKGYAIDCVANLLENQNVRHYKIDIGGDLRTSGSPIGDDAWKIIVQQPPSDTVDKNPSPLTVHLNNAAVATTGDYHRYVTVNGKKRPHVLNPETGEPVQTSLASVSVLASTALKADGLATACFVLGESDARKTVNTLEGIEALFIRRTASDNFRISRTKGWPN